MKKALVAFAVVFAAACGTGTESEVPGAEPAPAEHLQDGELGQSNQELHTHKYCGGPYYYCSSADHRWHTYNWCCSGHAYNNVAHASCNVPR